MRRAVRLAALRRHMGGIFLRIAAMFLVVLVFSSAVVLFFMNSVFQEKAYDEIARNQNYSMQKMADSLTAYVDGIDQMTRNIICDESIQNTLIYNDPGSHALNAVLSANAYVSGLYIMFCDSQGNVYCSSNLHQPRRTTDMLLESELYIFMQDTYAALKWELTDSTLLSYQPSVKEPYMLTAGRRVRHLDLNVPGGYIVVQVFPSSLAAQIQDPLMHSQTRYLLLDVRNRVVYDSLGQLEIGDVLDAPELLAYAASGETNYFGQAELGEQLYTFGSVPQAGLTMISCLPGSAVSSLPDLFMVLLRASALGMAIALGLALCFSTYFSLPIMEIVLSMREVRNGNFSVRVKPRHSGELGELAYTFNVMTQDMEALIEQTKKDQRELKSAEFSALIYQINPHFIYNTLDNINMLAKLNEDNRMSILITELSSLLRITLSGGQESISVENELKHVSCYLRIMQLRSDNLFSYEIHCEKGLEKTPVLKLILQPIAENAIQHGFAYTDEGGLCRIQALTVNGNLAFRVEDNGMGMEQEDMDQMPQKLMLDCRTSPENDRGIGLKNVYRRLKLYYGADGFSMRFSRSELGGLCVEIIILDLKLNK